jgi:glyceraldehyde 3-phosphate dehydrogenase
MAEGERNYGINGAGQIGTGILRINAERGDAGERCLPITAITDDYLSRDKVVEGMLSDKVYGPPKVDVRTEGDDKILIGGQVVKFANVPADKIADWASQGVWGVFEATGSRVQAGLAEEHLTEGGAERVLITAPSKGALNNGGAVKSLLMGFNEDDYDPESDRIVDNASCTTKSSALVVKALDDEFGVSGVVLVTIHALTGKARRDIIAASGLVDEISGLGFKPAPTGAKGALAKLFPHIDVAAEAYRVPTPDGSISDITLLLKSAATVEEVRAVLKLAAQSRVLQVVDHLESSANLIGNPSDSVVQIGEGKVSVVGGKLARVPAGYDNGFAPADAALHMMEYMDAQEG